MYLYSWNGYLLSFKNLESSEIRLEECPRNKLPAKVPKFRLIDHKFIRDSSEKLRNGNHENENARSKGENKAHKGD
jgi:hypothetical protein